MAPPTETAVITGGSSGMGLAVAQALAERGGWKLHLLDLRPPLEEVANSTFHKVNVTEYDSLAAIFQKAFDSDGRIDFVFANAGIVERFNFYEAHPAGKPPSPPDLTVLDVNLKSVIHTSWLAQHYFRQSKSSTNKNLVMTSSVGGLYACPVSPSYCATKHGVVGLMRSIAKYYHDDPDINARVNTINPGTVRTNLLNQEAWDAFDNEFVPIEKISATVLMLIDGYDVGASEVGSKSSTNGANANGNGHGGQKLYGKAVELSGTQHYYRDQPPFCDEQMAKTMGGTEKTTYAEAK